MAWFAPIRKYAVEIVIPEQPAKRDKESDNIKSAAAVGQSRDL